MTDPLTLEDLIARESPEMQAKIEVEYRKLRQQVDDQRGIQQIVRLASTEMARRMRTNEALSSKVEHKVDRALRVLRSFVDRMDGEVEISIQIKGHSPVQFKKSTQNRINGHSETEVIGPTTEGLGSLDLA